MNTLLNIVHLLQGGTAADQNALNRVTRKVVASYPQAQRQAAADQWLDANSDTDSDKDEALYDTSTPYGMIDAAVSDAAAAWVEAEGWRSNTNIFASVDPEIEQTQAGRPAHRTPHRNGSFILSEDDHAKIERVAAALNVKKSEAVRRMIRAWEEDQ